VTPTPPSTLHASGARRLVSVQQAPPFTAGRHHRTARFARVIVPGHPYRVIQPRAGWTPTGARKARPDDRLRRNPPFTGDKDAIAVPSQQFRAALVQRPGDPMLAERIRVVASSLPPKDRLAQALWVKEFNRFRSFVGDLLNALRFGGGTVGDRARYGAGLTACPDLPAWGSGSR
jgi:hypothetical protein